MNRLTLNFVPKFLHLSLIGICGIILYSYGTHAHYNEWVAAKIYPALALSNSVDLFQKESGPFILTIYGPGSPIFYLPTRLGNSPEQCIWIAYTLNLLVLAGAFYFVFGKQNQTSRFSPSLCMGFTLVFLLANDQTTFSLFQVHHDMPVFAYLLLGSIFLLGKKPTNSIYRLWLGSFFLWMACWTKIVALPWLLLPFLQLLISKKRSENLWLSTGLTLIGTGLISFLFFDAFFGSSDLLFHLFESTNSYPWRSCNSLFGEGEIALLANNFNSKAITLLRISLLYAVEYWWLVLCCFIIGLHNLKSKKSNILLWLVLCYFLALPTCLSALAKFGGVANSLVFAHAPAFAALFLQASKLIDRLITSETAKICISFIIAIIPALVEIRVAASIRKDPSQSPLQLGYEYLLENPDNPVYFAFPLPNYLATGKIWSSGEALTYATMMKQDSLPENAGLDFMQHTDLIAFGNPPYSRSYFDRKLDLTKILNPKGLECWNIYKAKRKE